MELLSILYAMLAALTGLAAGGEAVAVRQPVVASAGARVEHVAAAATVRTVPSAVFALVRPDRRRASAPWRRAVAARLTRFAQIDFGRWHE